ncbi:MAG: rod shape-determining protein MreC [Butyricicoccus pullicaecorum]|nr:rod shape-determining protein MreC [Butyricicoccus pullicaecorum]
MRKIFTTRLLAVILLIAAVCLGLAAYTGAAGQDSPVSAAVGTALAPLQKGVSIISGKAEHFISHFQNYDAMVEENKELRKKVAELEQQVRNAQIAVDENEQLRVLTGLVKNNPTFHYDMAEVIAHSPGQWTTTISIDKGTMDGVAENDLVVTAEGMVGYVSLAAPNYSQVTTVLDTNMQAGALVTRTRESGVAQGDYELMGDGMLRMSYLGKDSDVVIGDTIQTSGEGGIFPKGIMIGTVERVMTEENGMNNYAVIRPFVDPADVTDVYIITDVVAGQLSTPAGAE